MKKYFKAFVCLLFITTVVACSKHDDNEPDEPSLVTLQDLAGKSIIVLYSGGFLTCYNFYSQNNAIYVNENNQVTSRGALTCVLRSKGRVSFEGGDGELDAYLSKDADGRLILDKFLFENDLPFSTVVLFNTADALSFAGKTYMENTASYIGFSTDKWGWSNTPNVQYTTSYGLPSSSFVYWKSFSSSSNLNYFGVNIPAGVKWGEHTGPLMLIDRTGFTTPSIYKPF